MKSPNALTTAILAATAMLGGSQSVAEPSITLKPSPHTGNWLNFQKTSARPRQSFRVAQNQRQRRKDARRAHAAGVRNAFA